MKASILFLTTMIVASACSSNDDTYDASGTFEAVETIVSAEASGTIEKLNIEEGQQLKRGATIGYIDSTQLHLKKKQLQAQMRPLETSLQRALDAFRGITAQLEDLLGSGSLRESEDLVELERGYYVSFSEALGEPVRTDHWEEAARPQEQRND